MSTKETILNISRFLPAGFPVHVFETVDSTNNVAKEMAGNGAGHGTTIIALHQEKGRGRLGRSFHTPEGQGIYMSIILRPDTDISRSMLITTAASVAVCRALKTVAGADPGIKWVNDIIIGGKKVCGILTEAIADPGSTDPDAIIVGIGINLSTEGFPEELQEIAGAVEGDFSPGRLAAEIIMELLSLTEKLDIPDFIDEYRSLSLVIGKTVKVHKGGYSGTSTGVPARVLDISNDGGLQVIYTDGSRETLSSGEISIRF
jgi:BirA family biotin operon repressor/biotin-[acetyl-CoA-carboxylase] ligase